MGGLWHYTGDAGVQFLVRYSRRASLAAICLDFEYAPEPLAASILSTLRVPCHSGMSFNAVRSLLGDPAESTSLDANHSEHRFECGEADRYVIVCSFIGDALRGLSVFRLGSTTICSVDP
jgi:hypothetical protein